MSLLLHIYLIHHTCACELLSWNISSGRLLNSAHIYIIETCTSAFYVPPLLYQSCSRISNHVSVMTCELLAIYLILQCILFIGFNGVVILQTRALQLNKDCRPFFFRSYNYSRLQKKSIRSFLNGFRHTWELYPK